MTPAQVIQQSQDNIQQANNDMAWIIVAFFIFVPLLFIIARAILVFSKIKCPNCGNLKNNTTAIQTTKTENIKGKTLLTVKKVFVCSKCHTEYPR